MDEYRRPLTIRLCKPSSRTQLEEILRDWFLEIQANNVFVTNNVALNKAREIAESIGVKSFIGSIKWIESFRAKHDLYFSSNSPSFDSDTVAAWYENLPKILAEYKPHDIYNAKEKIIRYKHGDKTGQITVLLCTNSNATEKLTPIIVVEELPASYKHKKFSKIYYEAKKGLITKKIFSSFLREFDNKVRRQQRNVILFMDHSNTHPKTLTFLKNVKVEFYPCIWTDLLQPMDVDILSTFANLLRKVSSEVFREKKQMGNSVLTLNNIMLTYFQTVNAAWNRLDRGVIVNAFLDCGYPDGVRKKNDVKNGKKSASNGCIQNTYDDQTSIVKFVAVANSQPNLNSWKLNLSNANLRNSSETLDMPAGISTPTRKKQLSFETAHESLLTLKSFFQAHDCSEKNQLYFDNMLKTLLVLKDRERKEKKSILLELLAKV